MPPTPLRHAVLAAALLLAGTAVPPPAAAQQDARAAGHKLMRCQLVGQVTSGVSDSLGAHLEIGLDASTGEVRVEPPPTLPPPAVPWVVELVWLGDEGLRAVAVVVRDRDLPERSPVAVLDLDYAESRLRYQTFGGARGFDAELYPIEYSCRRLN